MSNIDIKTVEGFGYEWSTFDQSQADQKELNTLFDSYFSLFPWSELDAKKSVGADFGCGSGRWSKFMAPKVGHMHLVDASLEALEVAKTNLAHLNNVSFHHGSIEEFTVADHSLDFAFSLGVLHHLPDTLQAMRDISKKLKEGAPFLVYLYYRFDNQPMWYQGLWRMSDFLRRRISKLPFPLRKLVSFFFAAFIYFPLAKLAKLIEALGLSVKSFPLSFYRNRSFYVMRTDAFDRMSTKLEKRYTRSEIAEMLELSDFEKVEFSSSTPYWCAIARKKKSHVG
jgi:SAM-dependent methyltransferase